jgi:hypothetical protein
MLSHNRADDKERDRVRWQHDHDSHRRRRHASSHDLLAAAWPPRGATDDVRTALRRTSARRLAADGSQQ